MKSSLDSINCENSVNSQNNVNSVSCEFRKYISFFGNFENISCVSKNWKNTSYIFQSGRQNMTLGGVYLLRIFSFMDLIISYFITSNLWEESVLKNLFCLFSRLKIRVIFSHVRGKEDFIAYYYCTERSEWDLIMCIFYDEHIIGSSGTRLYLCKHMIHIYCDSFKMGSWCPQKIKTSSRNEIVAWADGRSNKIQEQDTSSRDSLELLR